MPLLTKKYFKNTENTRHVCIDCLEFIGSDTLLPLLEIRFLKERKHYKYSQRNPYHLLLPPTQDHHCLEVGGSFPLLMFILLLHMPVIMKIFNILFKIVMHDMLLIVSFCFDLREACFLHFCGFFDLTKILHVLKSDLPTINLVEEILPYPKGLICLFSM